MIYTCCDENRRAAVEAHPTLNGIDWLEVLDNDAPPDSPRQRTLLLRLLKPVPPALSREQVRIRGGERIRRTGIEWVATADAPPAEATPDEIALFAALEAPERVLVVRTDSEGDFSTYRLTLVRGEDDADTPPTGFDPRLSAVDFSFKVECPSPFDCKPRHDCPEPLSPAPDLDYLARDYDSLRRLLTDRLASRMPGWRDRSPADVATTLVELIAYVGDLQHYRLDAIATEAYFDTARLRRSLRRHALLVDYPMHDGCNARAWLHVAVSGAAFELPGQIRFLTRVPGLPGRIEPDSPDERSAVQAAPETFEPMHPATLREAHNRLHFHTWGNGRCCLPRGATRATLRGHWPDLAAGDVLVLIEERGPATGLAEDADPAHRHAVRLTRVRAHAVDDDTEVLVDPLDDTPITEIEWHRGDALPFPLCISAEGATGDTIADVSVALGNIVLVDHGLGIVDPSPGQVPDARLHYPRAAAHAAHDPCHRTPPEPLPPRFSPALAEGPVTRQGTVSRTTVELGLTRRERLPFDDRASATSAMRWHTGDALPAITLVANPDAEAEVWTARRDLLNSRSGDTHFVLESGDEDATIRFGDDRHGRRPEPGTRFVAHYRVGNGPAGNVGAGAIAHAVSADGRIESVTNPMAATGGRRPETRAEVRRRAPHAFRTQQRAVTPADYAEVCGRMDGVQQAAARLRWTGSWHTMFVTVDRDGGEPVDTVFAAQATDHLERFRMAGHDLRVEDPLRVSLELEMMVCVDAHHFRSDVRRGLLEALGNHVRGDGRRALFHPDNFSFGQPVYLSPILAAARAVAGVTSAQILRLARQGRTDENAAQDGMLPLGPLEIARLDNDPNHPEHGVLRLELHGGK